MTNADNSPAKTNPIAPGDRYAADPYGIGTGAVYAVTEPDYLGEMLIRTELFSEPYNREGSMYRQTVKGWAFEQIEGFGIVNPYPRWLRRLRARLLRELGLDQTWIEWVLASALRFTGDAHAGQRWRAYLLARAELLETPTQPEGLVRMEWKK